MAATLHRTVLYLESGSPTEVCNHSDSGTIEQKRLDYRLMQGLEREKKAGKNRELAPELTNSDY